MKRYIIIGCLFLFLVGTNFFMYNTVQNQSKTIGELSIKLERSEARTTALEENMRNLAIETMAYNVKRHRNDSALSNRINKLETNVSRGERAIAEKPKLVEKLIQKDYEEFSQRLDCLTGNGKVPCED